MAYNEKGERETLIKNILDGRRQSYAGIISKNLER